VYFCNILRSDSADEQSEQVAPLAFLDESGGGRRLKRAKEKGKSAVVAEVCGEFGWGGGEELRGYASDAVCNAKKIHTCLFSSSSCRRSTVMLRRLLCTTS